MNSEIAFFVFLAVVVICICGGAAYSNRCHEQTKQIAIQLQIEMVKAGVTNVPNVKLP